MSISEKDWDYEVERLKKIHDIILSELDRKKNEIKSNREQIISARKSMWEEAPGAATKFEEVVDIQQYLDRIKREWEKYQFYNKLMEKLEKIKVSPYFARVDFKEDQSDSIEKIYIGISSLINNDTRQIYIYDWRAPISGIFYDYEIGRAGYKSPEGVIEGEIYLKRQYKISGHEIEYMFDSSVKIDDDILQKILSKNTDDKMRNIVTTIQKEQNRIIRDEDNDILIVQGPAGSGKTSVALHRVAYLLYKYRDSKINSSNIIIFSPNQVFNDYISNVLPELGEENMKQTTFTNYTKQFIEPYFKLEDFNDQMEYVLSLSDTESLAVRVKAMEYKSSRSYLSLIKRYLDYIEHNGMKFYDIKFNGNIIISKEEIWELFHSDYKSLPISKRLSRIEDRILMILEPERKKRNKEVQDEIEESGDFKGEVEAASRVMTAKEFKIIREQVHEMCTINTYKAYLRLYEDRDLINELSYGMELPKEHEGIRIGTLGMLERRVLSFEDLPAFLIIKFALEGTPDSHQIKHVLIDEAQDYSVLHFELIKKLFQNASITLLGDHNQSINPYTGIGNYDRVLEIFKEKKSEVLYLNKCYRSTWEIYEFAKAVLSEGGNIETIDRRGVKPMVVKISEEKNKEDTVLKYLSKLKYRGMKSIAIICKNEIQSRSVYNSLEDKSDINIITRGDDEFKTGTVVVPSYLAKGLEFDAIIIYDACHQSYYKENERKLFYTICTRALHELVVCYRGKPSPFISDMDSSLYEFHK